MSAVKMTLATREYREVNQEIRDAVASGETEFELDQALGQRYIGDAAPPA